jgi:sporulation protein YlmC with PRC-barrel domain
MAANQLESSRVAAGTLNPGAQKLADSSHTVPTESVTVSRDDVRDGVSENPINQSQHNRVVVHASTLVGYHVRNPAGESLGKIRAIMLDIEAGRIAYAALSFGGFLGISDKLFAVPWNELRIERGQQEFILDIARVTLERAPGFDEGDWPEMANPAFATAVHRHYGNQPYRSDDA